MSKIHCLANQNKLDNGQRHRVSQRVAIQCDNEIVLHDLNVLCLRNSTSPGIILVPPYFR